ncbi:4'-phosphopantetheinyl transferase family protein [Methylobacterium marchantiae]|uniref:4'-phosphopantetheinyl transferase family protein n=1 Tax=Methylobacterium marchantiae TaxID=600331 RepID=A0ABW3X5S8_9HYPH|nr:4'-phosphopantetheinyl transferase Sfp [Methylobacterium marchantiae]
MTTAAPDTDGRVTVWDIDLAPAAAHRDACLALLSDDERARTSRFLRDEDRLRYAASHAALRLVLGHRLRTDPRGLAFGTGRAGKPHLAGVWAGSCRFSLSHSGSRALVGLSASAEIGVDVEEMRPMPDLLRIARAHFAASEIADLDSLAPDRLTPAFFACWTRKEAVVKATGEGLSLPLDSFSVSVSPAKAVLLSMPGGAREWSLHTLPTAPGYAAALAVAAADAGFVRRALPPDWPDRIAAPSQQGR